MKLLRQETVFCIYFVLILDLCVMKADMKTAEKHVKTIERIINSCFCGIFPKFWKKSKTFKGNPAVWKETSTTEDLLTRSKNKTKDNKKKKVNKQDQIDFEFQKITNCSKEDRMATNMGLVLGEIGTIKNMAIDIGNEIDRSNKKLPELTLQTEENKCHIDFTNKKMKKL